MSYASHLSKYGSSLLKEVKSVETEVTQVETVRNFELQVKYPLPENTDNYKLYLELHLLNRGDDLTINTGVTTYPQSFSISYYDDNDVNWTTYVNLHPYRAYEAPSNGTIPTNNEYRYRYLFTDVHAQSIPAQCTQWSFNFRSTEAKVIGASTHIIDYDMGDDEAQVLFYSAKLMQIE